MFFFDSTVISLQGGTTKQVSDQGDPCLRGEKDETVQLLKFSCRAGEKVTEAAVTPLKEVAKTVLQRGVLLGEEAQSR